MNIVAVAACTSGIAHTYIAKESSFELRKVWDTQSMWKHRERSVLRMN